VPLHLGKRQREYRTRFTWVFSIKPVNLSIPFVTLMVGVGVSLAGVALGAGLAAFFACAAGVAFLALLMGIAPWVIDWEFWAKDTCRGQHLGLSSE